MKMCSSSIWILFIPHILIHLVGLTIAQPNFPGYFCNETGGNYTSNTYLTNLDSVSYALQSGIADASSNGFYNFSSGANPDTVYGIALCRGRVTGENCTNCVRDSVYALRRDCPNRNEAIGWYPNCMLRYSNRYIFSTMESNPTFYIVNDSVASDVVNFDRVRGSLLENLKNEAAGGGSIEKFATDMNATGQEDNPTIYAIVHCTPDITEQQCNDCLEQGIGALGNCCSGSIGARILKASCFIWYETRPFYDETPSPRGRRGRNTRTIALITAPTLAAAVIIILILFVYRRRTKKGKESLLHKWNAPSSTNSLKGSKSQNDEDDSIEMHYFNLTTIEAATNFFSVDNKLGEGGFGPVYKGKLDDGKEIAVKRLSKNSGQGLEEFKTEVRLIVKLQHKNLVRLLGCCVERDEKLLVYEYMVNTSLDAFLFDPKKCKELDWNKRANIVGGIAKGLRYLHEDSRLRIIHRDMKVSNVLLDNEMNSKISDFGTARIFGGNQINASTNRVVGTFGYMAPEYAMEGLFSTKSDVYSFGVLLLEIITGKRNSSFYHPDCVQNLVSYAWRLWKDGKGQQLIDQNLMESCPVTEALRWINIALLCVQEDPKYRPTMSSVVFMLEGQWTCLSQPSEPPFSVGRFIASDQSSSIGSGTGIVNSYQSSTSASS